MVIGAMLLAVPLLLLLLLGVASRGAGTALSAAIAAFSLRGLLLRLMLLLRVGMGVMCVGLRLRKARRLLVGARMCMR